MLQAPMRRAILAGIRKNGVKLTHKITPLKAVEDDEDLL
jgi:hypothetical protein